MEHLNMKFYEIVEILKKVLQDNIDKFNIINVEEIKYFIDNEIRFLYNEHQMYYYPIDSNRGEFGMYIEGVEFIVECEILNNMVVMIVDDFYTYTIEDLYNIYLSIDNRRQLNNIFTNVYSGQEFLQCIKTFSHTTKVSLKESDTYKILTRNSVINSILG